MACDFYKLAVPGVKDLHPYQPGKPVDELERELGITDSIKLASNENPLGPSSAVSRAINTELADLSRYPDANGFALKAALQARFGIAADSITLGNGSNDVLELLGRVFLQSGDEVIYSAHAFVVYMLVTQASGAKGAVTPARDWGHDLDAMAGAITAKTRMIFIANPNNPTGTWLSKAALQSFLEKVPEDVLVVLDEAYTEYVAESDFPNGLELQKTFKNLIVTRTFSKAYGLAAMRVGYAVATPEITDLLNRVRPPFNVNSLALAAAVAALGDEEHLQRSVSLNAQGMQQLEQGFASLGLSWIPSVGNFITLDCGQDAAPVYQGLLQEGVIVRPVANYGLPNHLRITVGLPEENQRCLDALQKVLNL
ncbi:histidinol-phosphate transaminase [Aliamphritea spongicola]|uniref:histidinol-phosphate transaminase n=1 Tax=Aliamphritea spongicola TaxID=707589 RepID=UPI00196B0D52|nr:histidinol-phosphate transaminase [Aliamphritea spongicola]MBN3564538.1 histidinol-phosphate transaminase [Aliamphritea spongicola]